MTYPVTLVQNQTRQAVGASSNKAGRRCHEPLVHDGQLEEVLCQCSSIQIVVISLADTSQETHRTRPSQLEAEHAKHESLSLENLVHGVAIVYHIDNLL
jgi:hypothetical protein